MKTESPLRFHLYNDKRVKSFQNNLPFFCRISNVSAMKIHQMTAQIGGVVRGVFIVAIIFEGDVKKSECKKNTLVVLDKPV